MAKPGGREGRKGPGLSAMMGLTPFGGSAMLRQPVDREPERAG